MKQWLVLSFTLVALRLGAVSAVDVEFEIVPAKVTGLKAALEKWYDVEMMRQGGPGKPKPRLVALGTASLRLQ